MKLQPADTRCLGLLPAPFGEIACTRRQHCARYVQRHDTGTRMSMWLCPDADAFWGKYTPIDQPKEKSE